ncbi:MAG: HD-GYP domain-containing protein [Syntrophaceticus sp.]|jgi:putative nucleotidyltransferase with HDIG domain
MVNYPDIAENLKNKQVLPHSINVFLVVYQVLSSATNIRLSRQEERDLLVAALLHDIGKSSWPEYWFVQPGYLLGKEAITMMRMHSLQGANLIKEAGLPEKVADIALQHHERPGGTGYPLREEPSYPALLLAACDVFCACTEDRPYRKHPLTQQDAIREVAKYAPVEVVKALIEGRGERERFDKKRLAIE